MKKTYLLMVLLGLSVAVLGQKPKKPKTSKAKTYWASGQYAEAREILDQAIEFEKIKDDPKTWYYHFLTYASIDTSSSINVENSFETALSSYNTYKEMNDGNQTAIAGPGGGLMVELQVVGGFANYYFEQGRDAFQGDDKPRAADMFENSSLLTEDDTLAITFAGYAAVDSDQDERGIKLLNEALNRGAKDVNIFFYLVSLYNDAENYDESLRIIQLAKEAYPGKQEFVRNEVSILIQMGKAEEALAKTDEAIQGEPSNPVYYYTKGLLLEELKRTDEALEAYQGAVTQDPNHYESNFNIGVIYLNRANEYLKEKNGLGISAKDLKRSKELEPLIKERLEAALPVWEKVYEIKSDEQATLETLAFIYNYLGMKDKATEFYDKLEAMGG